MPAHHSQPRDLDLPIRGGPTHVVPTGAALGATVKGVDLKDLDDVAFARIMQAWHDHSVLLVRGQTLSDQELIAFSRRFGESRLGPDPGDGPPFRRGPAGNLHRLQRQGERRADRQPGRWRSGVAHGHVVSRSAAEGEHALRARSAADRRQHLVLHDVRHLRCAACQVEGAHRRAQASSTTAPTTAAAMCARASRRPTIR